METLSTFHIVTENGVDLIIRYDHTKINCTMTKISVSHRLLVAECEYGSKIFLLRQVFDKIGIFDLFFKQCRPRS